MSRPISPDAITARQAWEILGSDPTYEPKRPDDPASGKILWVLNMQGLLVLPTRADPAEPPATPDVSVQPT